MVTSHVNNFFSASRDLVIVGDIVSSVGLKSRRPLPLTFVWTTCDIRPIFKHDLRAWVGNSNKIQPLGWLNLHSILSWYGINLIGVCCLSISLLQISLLVLVSIYVHYRYNFECVHPKITVSVPSRIKYWCCWAKSRLVHRLYWSNDIPWFNEHDFTKFFF